MFVVDLKRHNDGEDGLVGPFHSRDAAEAFVATLDNKFGLRDWACVRPVEAKP